MVKYNTIALLTDFGTDSPFAGIMKGVIKGLNSCVSIIDLNHGIPPGDVMTASFELGISAEYFNGTIFVCVVDPGVGTERKILLAKTKNNLILAPDNGLLTGLNDAGKLKEIFEVSNENYYLTGISGKRSTFDGRDIFAPVSAHLSKGVSPGVLGGRVKKIKKLKISKPVRKDKKILCEIIYIDSFGNCWTNIKDGKMKIKRAESGSVKVKNYGKNYSGKGSVMLFNSFGFLEFAVPGGSFAEKHKIRIRRKFEVENE